MSDSEKGNMTPEQIERCADCGYSKEDAQINGDHRLCKNSGNAPWEKSPEQLRAGETIPDDLKDLYLAELEHRDKPLDDLPYDEFTTRVNARTTCNLIERIGKAEAEIRGLSSAYDAVLASSTRRVDECDKAEQRAEAAEAEIERLKDTWSGMVRQIRETEPQELKTLRAKLGAVREALSELVDTIEDSGGHTEDGDVFDITKALAALAATEKGEL